ncbi:MAG: YcxB family protein [Bacilli bacterium]
MDKVISKTKYSRKQHKDYYKYHMLHKSFSTYFIFLIAIFIIVVAIINTINALKTDGDIGQVFILWGFAAFSVMIAPMMMISKINNIVKNETVERKDSTDTIEVTKVKITRSNTTMEGKAVIGWNQVESINETKQYIYIYTGPSTGIFIVKDDIIEGSVELFRKIAKDNMKKTKKGKVKYTEYNKVKK